MLKFIRGLVIFLVVLIGVAYVSPTYAASANVIITQVQAGGVGAALEEIVVIYNNSPDEVNISDWCVKNKSNISFACFSHEPMKSVYLPGYSYATMGSQALANTIGFTGFSIIYSPTNQSSGSIVGGSDTISLVNQQGTVIDSHAWTTSLIGGMLFSRHLSPTSPIDYIDTDQSSDWQIQPPQFIPNDGVVVRDADPDICPNIDGYQAVVPDGLELRSDGSCKEKLYSLRLSEIFPNASGSDAGKEFIEIYNPNDVDIDLTRYELLVGQNLEKTFTFPVGSIIAARSYSAFTNSDIPFSLLNTSSRVMLKGDGEVLDESLPYLDPDEDTSWAIVEGSWQYTNVLTPGSENIRFGEGVVTNQEAEEKTSTLKPCAENQYRSPETNRCRNVDTVTPKTQTQCKDGQYRSEETNRCRNIASTTDTPAPCKEGQERSPETNRCRMVKTMSKVDYGVLGVTMGSQKDQNYIWLAVGGIVLLALAYAVWEWRFEISKLFKRIGGFVRIRK